MSRTKRWAFGAVIAVLCSFAYARAPGMPHSGGPAGGHGHAAASAYRTYGTYGTYGAYRTPGGTLHREAAPTGSYARNDRHAQSASQPLSRSYGESRRAPVARPENYAGDQFADGFGAYNTGAHRAGPPAYRNAGRDGMQFAGAITPVSTESRSVPRPPPNAPVRTGSIRADVARYNEERGAPRMMQRQAGDSRPAEDFPYRN
ncbi:hypothetical protein [Paraburkholderia sp. BCC1886]|uniref:hypothetical protein n=1 Tax=Paraburkholderia sp. BCC1886 TaxID=2562670 RepID=UPI0028CB6733|nr:hypothetical protein [Paraburkholderia sp. BCC1886]